MVQYQSFNSNFAIFCAHKEFFVDSYSHERNITSLSHSFVERVLVSGHLLTVKQFSEFV
jgi:hypothetical protein